MKVQRIREAFLDFFEQKNHKIIQSSSLLPQDDPTLLFTNAGMNQFKNLFLGLEKRSYSRAASVQKCMRVSGKHNDLEQVGITSKHHTFFEMLGNFSFGDYFKQGAIEFAWELITEVYKMAPERLYATVYKEDIEAFDIWHKRIGLPENKIFRLGKEDNYWSMGETGPCGPCSEIHYDLEPEADLFDPKALIESGDERFVELWNLVFMQFNQDAEGGIQPLPAPSVDTGMGLERMATVLQNKISNYDTDLFQPIITEIEGLSDYEYRSDANLDIAVRIIADHIRAVSFLIGDGIMPANEGRGYVLRRLIRRAYRAGNKLGLDEPFLYKLIGWVCDIMKDAYPELLASTAYIANVCQSEEKRFALTLSSGLKTFHQFVEETKGSDGKVLTGDKLFKLYDTFGFPLDLSEELAQEQKLEIDIDGFYSELEQQKERARLAWKGDARQQEKQAYEGLTELRTQFVGYEENSLSEARVLVLMKGGSQVSELQAGDKGEVFLEQTPFYAEAGGQVGDKGVLKNPHFSAKVVTAYFPIPDIISHEVEVLSGALHVGDDVEAVIDLGVRKAITKNHTATHLLHAALKQILGDHVKQAGSLVSPSRLRFDFTHFSPLNSSEIKGIENLVNEKIQENIVLDTAIMSMEEGIQAGAVAIFEEKYKEDVRVVSIPGFSKELCGGVHVKGTGQIGLFKIISEASVAAGMRRIEALTGETALKYVQENEDLLLEIQQIINTPRQGILQQLDKMKTVLKDKEKELKSIRQKMANLNFPKKDKDAAVKEIEGISILIKKVEGLNNTELRELADSFKQKLKSGVVVLGTVSGDKVFLVTTVSPDLSSRLPAHEIIRKIAPLIGGGGGGRPDFAQAGGSKPEQLQQTLQKSLGILETMIRTA